MHCTAFLLISQSWTSYKVCGVDHFVRLLIFKSASEKFPIATSFVGVFHALHKR